MELSLGSQIVKKEITVWKKILQNATVVITES